MRLFILPVVVPWLFVLHIPLDVYAVISAYKSLIENVPDHIIIANDAEVFKEIDRDLNSLKDFTKKLIEIAATLDENRPIFLSATEIMDRYRNLEEFHRIYEGVFQALQNLTARVDLLARNGYAVGEQLEQLTRLGDSIRFLGNELVKVLRWSEDAIRAIEPAFEFLGRQWFEL